MFSTSLRTAACVARSVAPAARGFATTGLPGGNRVFVVGVGMTKFEKPGSRDDFDYPDMVREAGTKALADAGIPFSAVQQACVGYVYGESTSGNRAVYELGMTGIPIYNVNNNCSTGSTALYMARQFVSGGVSDCVMAVGFEKMQRGSLPLGSEDRENPLGRHMHKMAEVAGGFEKAPPAPWLFACAGREHMELYGTKPEAFGMIAEKNHRHSANNPYAQFQDVYTLDQIMSAKPICDPLTMLMCSPTSDGSAAAILASEAFVKEHGLQDKAVEIVGQAMTTDDTESFDNARNLVGSNMARHAADQVYAQAGLSAADVDVVELHDCFATNELLTYEALRLCGEGEAGALVEDGQVTYGGKYVVNPSGGLISKGHPLGATGLAQCSELCWQLRGEADARQVDGAEVALQHNLGLGGAAVVTMYRKADL